MDINKIFDVFIEANATDIFIKGDSPLRMRSLSEVKAIEGYRFSAKDVNELVAKITDDYGKEELRKNKNCEFAIQHGERWRFRVAVFYEKNAPVVVIRRYDLDMLSFQKLNLPEKVLEKFCQERRGLILLSGMTGSGKSTAIAAMIEFINQRFGKHILTIEEPVEFTFREKMAIINQREIGRDVPSYETALRQFLVHSPDVLYISNIRDQYTCQAALTAAETGILVLSTVHAINASSTVARLLNFFPTDQQGLMLHLLSFLLKGVISLRLVPRVDTGGLVPAYEVMTLSPTISDLIRKDQLSEIPKCIADSEFFGMNSFNQCLFNLIVAKKISKEVAFGYSDDIKELTLMLSASRI